MLYLSNIIPSGTGDNSIESNYFSILENSPYKYAGIELFNSSTSFSLKDAGSSTFDSVNKKLFVPSNTSIITNNLLEYSAKTFTIFVDTDNNIKIEYSIDGINFVEVENGEDFVLNETNNLYVKVTVNEDSLIQGIMVLYYNEGYNQSAEQGFEVSLTLDENKKSGDVIVIPEDKVYNPDSKTLSVYLNGVLLERDVDYLYENSNSIKILKDIDSGNILTFKDYYGYIFINGETVSLMKVSKTYKNINNDSNVEVNDYVFADSSNGAFTLTLPLNPSIGDELWILDNTGSFENNNVTLDGNGKNIMSDSTFALNKNNLEYKVIFNGSEWRVV